MATWKTEKEMRELFKIDLGDQFSGRTVDSELYLMACFGSTGVETSYCTTIKVELYYCKRFFINALPGSSYVNMVQHATIGEAVFSVSSEPSNSRNGVHCDQLLGYTTVLTIELLSVWSVLRLYNEIPFVYSLLNLYTLF
jgi:hypothetical protein